MTQRLALLLAAAAIVLLVGVAGVLTLWDGEDSDPDPAGEAVPAGREFLDAYVEDDGRVVRHDEGGDTVSEGQAYAMLIAVGIGDQDTFDLVWDWTRENLQRPDGLLSWRWQEGAVQDESSAADADLDAARALVVAGERFDDHQYVEDGVALGAAVLDHETVQTPAGRVLVAGQWATEAPFAFNPSYVSPAATQVLGEASGDPRWEALERGSRKALHAVAPAGRLPPDWASLGADGSATPSSGPGGQPVQHSYDAARVLVRQAESCDEQDVELVAPMSDLLDESPAVAAYDLSGSPTSDTTSPVATVARAAALAASGDTDAAAAALAEARAPEQPPTYYGDAWAALGSLLLEEDVLGGCPPLGTGDS
jgi:endo-1,4-beta-D-glucanase Y